MRNLKKERNLIQAFWMVIILTVLSVVLKLFKAIKWKWIWVVCPVWIFVAVCVLDIAVAAAFGYYRQRPKQ